jgi:hypothetical protein
MPFIAASLRVAWSWRVGRNDGAGGSRQFADGVRAPSPFNSADFQGLVRPRRPVLLPSFGLKIALAWAALTRREPPIKGLGLGNGEQLWIKLGISFSGSPERSSRRQLASQELRGRRYCGSQSA